MMQPTISDTEEQKSQLSSFFPGLLLRSQAFVQEVGRQLICALSRGWPQDPQDENGSPTESTSTSDGSKEVITRNQDAKDKDQQAKSCFVQSAARLKHFQADSAQATPQTTASPIPQRSPWPAIQFPTRFGRFAQHQDSLGYASSPPIPFDSSFSEDDSDDDIASEKAQDEHPDDQASPEINSPLVTGPVWKEVTSSEDTDRLLSITGLPEMEDHCVSFNQPMRSKKAEDQTFMPCSAPRLPIAPIYSSSASSGSMGASMVSPSLRRLALTRFKRLEDEPLARRRHLRHSSLTRKVQNIDSLSSVNLTLNTSRKSFIDQVHGTARGTILAEMTESPMQSDEIPMASSLP